MGCGFTGCPQCSTSWGEALGRAPGPTLQGLPLKLLKAPETTECPLLRAPGPSSVWSSLQAAEAVSRQAASLHQRSVCLICRSSRRSFKLLGANNPASCLGFPSPWDGSCFLLLSLRYLGVPFLTFQSANTSVSHCLY